MKRRLAFGVFVALIGALLLVQHHWRAELGTKIEAIIQYLRAMGVMGLLATALLQFLVAASGILPASLLGVAAGAAYGLPTGFAISSTGVIAGALAAFWLSRSVFRPIIAQYLHKKAGWHNFDRAVARDGWRFVCLVRLSPIMPFAIASYTLGLSSIRLRDYLLGTLASLPALGLYVFFGTLAHAGLLSLASSKNPWNIALLVVGGAATIGLCVRIGQIATRAAEHRVEEAGGDGG